MTTDTTIGYSPLGVPLNAGSAVAMSTAEIKATVLNVLAHLGVTTVEEFLSRDHDPDGSVAVKSHSAIAAFDEIVANIAGLEKFNLSKITPKRWSSFDGLTSVIAEVFAKLAVHA
jgi:hypothetical protein